jgi:very-short-patch-repair endonuclease
MRDASDPDILAMTQELVDYIRFFAVSRQKPLREFPVDEPMILLADWPDLFTEPKPDEQKVFTADYVPPQAHPPVPGLLRGWIDARAAASADGAEPELAPAGPAPYPGNGADTQVSVTDTVSQSDAPEVVSAYRGWVRDWRSWAEAERQTRQQRDLHRKLLGMSARISEAGAAHEAVLAVGLLTRSFPGAPRLSRHVLTRRVFIQMDQDTASITVMLDSAVPCNLEDQDFLGPEDGYSAERSAGTRADLAGKSLYPLGSDVWRLLCLWASRSFDDGVHCHGEWTVPSQQTGPLTLALAPAIIVRKRGGSPVARFYDQIAADLALPGALAPLGLAQLVAPLEREERLAWNGTPVEHSPAAGPPLLPKATNEAQRQVLHRMRSDTAVVVQGPPGTGKTHTIANLICALLAEGKKVLVTSEKEQALGELRKKLPAQVQDLCVAMTETQHVGADDFEQSITSLAERLGSLNLAAVERDVKRLTARREALLGEQEQLYAEIVRSREAEWVLHPEVAPGYSGTLADIASRVAAVTPRFEWLHSLAPDSAGAGGPPLSAAEALELLVLLNQETPERRARLVQMVPVPDSIPSLTRFEPLAAAAHEADGLAAHASDLVHNLATLGEAALSVIAKHADAAAVAAHKLRLPQRLAAWPPDNWQTRLLMEKLEHPGGTTWPDLDSAARDIEQAQRQISGAGPRQVTIPALAREEITEMIRTGAELRRYLMRGGRLRRVLPAREQRQAQFLLSSCLVDGQPPSTLHDVATTLEWLQAQLTTEVHARRLELADSPWNGGTSASRLARLADLYARMQQLKAIADAHEAVDALLMQKRVLLPGMGTAEGWDAIRYSLPDARLLAEAQRHRAGIDAFAAELPPPHPLHPPEVAALRRAAAEADAPGYEQALAALRNAYREWRDQHRSDILLTKIERRHPRLACELTATAADPVWEERLQSLPEAWAWLSAKAFCNTAGAATEQNLQRRLDENQLRLGEETAQLAAARAWQNLQATITQHQRQALAGYRAAVSDLGKGKGRHKEVKQAAVRSAMQDARGAVPAWIMPISKVAETVPLQRDSFDVVIIDEASQAGLDSAFLLWLAPTVIAVGDDKQCAPGNPNQDNRRYLDQLSTRFPTLALHERNALGPDSNLYALLSQHFPDPVRLREHFRSMPEIIGWSSQTFYRNSLIPLRQFGTDRLPPLQVIHVEDGRADRSLRNEPEARHLIEKLKELLEDPAYLKPAKSFAIIALQDGDQVKILQDMVNELPPEVVSRHSIRVGTPPQFQGAEADVVMLSMVVSGKPRALTGRQSQRRLNVAASRARDQMWLFTSVKRTDLSGDDVRGSFLSYMETYSRNPLSSLGHSPAADEVSPDTLQHPFDSLFEQRVFREIRQRGYHVIPRHPAGDHQIDLVVSGSAARLAVECDGLAPRAEPGSIRADLIQERELRRAGWKFWRIRESDFVADPERSMEPLWKLLDTHGIFPHDAQADPAPQWTPWSPITLRSEEDDSEDVKPDNED